MISEKMAFQLNAGGYVNDKFRDSHKQRAYYTIRVMENEGETYENIYMPTLEELLFACGDRFRR